MADIIIPGTDKVLLDGTIVILAGFDNVRYILHNGYYTYNDELSNGWYGVSVPEQNIIPVTVDMLIGCEVVYYPDSNCQCKYPSGNIPYTTDDKFQLQRAFITVDTMMERDALSPNLSITNLADGKIVRVNKPNNVDYDPKYYAYRYTEELTGAYWEEVDFGGTPKIEAFSSDFELDPETNQITLSESGKITACVVEYLSKSTDSDQYPTDKVELNLNRLQLIRDLDDAYQSQYGRYLIYINIGNRYYPATAVRDVNNFVIGVQTIAYISQTERLDAYYISGTTVSNYAQEQTPIIELVEFDEYSSQGAAQRVIAEWLYGLIDVPGGIVGLDNNGHIDTSVIPTNTFDPYGAAQAVQDAISALIPNTASPQNQLADKNFVNSSIATNTAYFIGTFNSVEELEAYSETVTNNDYAFVIEYDSQGQVVAYNRYKYNSDTQEWMYEYTLNNSSFTAEQWAAINSGMTDSLVATIQSHVANTTIHVTANDKTNWNNKISSSEKGVAGGVPTLGNDGKIPKSQLPPTVPDGGTSGQVLTKQSDADGDADWDNIPFVAPITGQLTLLASNWVADQTADNVFTQAVTIPSSNTNSKVDIDPSADVLNQMITMGIKTIYISNDNGNLSAVAIGTQPTEDMTVNYSMTIVVSADTSGSVVNVNDVIQTTGDLVILNAGTSTSDTSDLYPNANGQSF